MQENNKSGVYLSDGTYLNADAGYANGDLWIWTRDAKMDLSTVFNLFYDRQMTSHIQYVITEDTVQTWDWFMRLTTLQVDEDGKVSIRMRKE